MLNNQILTLFSSCCEQGKQGCPHEHFYSNCIEELHNYNKIIKWNVVINTK